MPAPPPPPPPAPPVPLAPPGSAANSIGGKLAPREEVRKLTGVVRERLDLSKDHIFLSYFNPVSNLLQDGPMCGLVALAMATTRHRPAEDNETSEEIVADIFQRAKSRGFTRQGEMFSAHEMSVLARDVLGCRARVVAGEESALAQTLLTHLNSGRMALVPYDADRNHEPCLKRGHKAHWAIITGCAYTVPTEDVTNCKHWVEDEECTWLRHHASMDSETDFTSDCRCRMCKLPALDSGNNPKLPALDSGDNPKRSTTDALMKSTGTPLTNTNYPDYSHVYVFAKQGKSRYTALWRLADLLSSNLNLQEASPQIRAEPAAWHLPAGPQLTGLRGQLVLLGEEATA